MTWKRIEQDFNQNSLSVPIFMVPCVLYSWQSGAAGSGFNITATTLRKVQNFCYLSDFIYDVRMMCVS